MSADTADANADICHECPDCGATFEQATAYGGHRSVCNEGKRCAVCNDLEPTSFEYYIHQTEVHDQRLARLDYLAPGEFEAAVDAADSVLDVADTLGWQIDRVFRALHIYGMADRVGAQPGGER